MSNGHGWVYRVLRFITKDEVKTPLAFIFKVVGWLVAALIVIIYAPISEEVKVGLVKFVFFCFLALAAVVLAFAWWRPKHLVYGETGHRAEHKIEYGTETHISTRAELDLLPNVPDPNQKRIGNR